MLMNTMIVEELNNMKRVIDYDDIYNRLISYIDSLNLLSYIRDDIQVIDGKKLYFRTIGIKVAGIDKPLCLDANEAYKEKIRVLYINTQLNNNGVSNKDELSKAICETYIENMKDSSFFSNYPNQLKQLAANSVEELSLKIGIVGF